MHSDKDFWTGLKWPAAPDEDDYRVFESYCKGKVLLLGNTKSCFFSIEVRGNTCSV